MQHSPPHLLYCASKYTCPSCTASMHNMFYTAGSSNLKIIISPEGTQDPSNQATGFDSDNSQQDVE